MPTRPSTTRTARIDARRGARLLAAGLGALLLAVAPSLAQPIEDRIDELIEAQRLEDLTLGVAAVDVSSGTTLCDYERASRKADPSPDGLMIPASNMKLLTSGAALLTLGPDHEFTTRFSVIDSRLVITGAGDPALADPDLLDEMDLDVEGFIDWLADAIERAEPGEITEVIADDRVFDRQYVHPDWETRHLHRPYGAEVCGLNFHRNVLRIYADRGRDASELPTVRSLPGADWIELVNRTRTGKRGGVPSVWGAREDATSHRFIVEGVVTGAQSFEVTAHEGSLILARLLADELRERGVGATSISARLARENEAIDLTGVEPVAVVRTPLQVVLDRCNKESENLYAESLLKLIGNRVTQQPGSWRNGPAVLRIHVRDRLGPEMVTSVIARDGSGLSRSNRVSAKLLAEWLTSIGREPDLRDPYVQSLPAPGEGTLRTRFRDRESEREVRAKSGYLNGVRTLSGYLVDRDTGRLIAFSILVNDIPTRISGTKVKDLHEKLVDMIEDAAFDDAGTPVEDGMTLGG